jgi:hypothetical protein
VPQARAGVRRTPLRFEGRVEPGPMRNSALGTSSHLEKPGADFGFLLLPPAEGLERRAQVRGKLTLEGQALLADGVNEPQALRV